jgi:hypothetical protein
MSFLYNQPTAHRFGVELQDLLESNDWNHLDAAVAWVRRPGTRHLLPSLQAFLQRGGAAKFIIGVDIENTSKEGLDDLLSLDAVGQCSTFIHHNESEVTFHPKLYLLAGVERARLIVGSNNLTEAGLFTNTEAGLQIEAAPGDVIIEDARHALAAWCDPETGLAKKLDQPLLDDLVTEGYVLTEEKLRQRRAQSRKAAGTKAKNQRRKLFANRPVRVPNIWRAVASATLQKMAGRVLLMRVRRASEAERRTQVQIPKRVVSTNFFEGMPGIKSSHNGQVHELHEARARGAVNTIKVEIPEIDSMDDPVVRLERTATDIFYEAYDRDSVLGRPIMDALERGRKMKPPVTELTLKNNPAQATWWRFV